jgi:hypothetical protein
MEYGIFGDEKVDLLIFNCVSLEMAKAAVVCHFFFSEIFLIVSLLASLFCLDSP